MHKIDTHQHLFYPNHFSYSWASDFPDLQGSFTAEAYLEAAEGCQIDSTLFMEVDVDNGQQTKEAAFFTKIAESSTNKLSGLIAKCLPESDDFLKEIESIRSPMLKGIRRVLHTQPDELSRSTLFRRNVTALGREALSFDLCVTQKQLPLALELVQACPDVYFILDHCGVPSIGEHHSTSSESWNEWKSSIQALGQLPNLACKFSGITVYATAEQCNVDGLRPYFNEILEAFGPKRIVWGSDWPVCNLAKGLRFWSDLTDALLGELTEDEQAAIAATNAKNIYKI